MTFSTNLLSLWKFSERALPYIYPDNKKSFLPHDLLVFTTRFLCNVRSDINRPFYYNRYHSCYNISIYGRIYGESTSWHKNGNIASYVTLINNKNQGKLRRWRDDGSIIQIESWKNGIYHGVNKLWANNGQLIIKERYQEGKRHGVCKVWRNDGCLISSCLFFNGKAQNLI